MATLTKPRRTASASKGKRPALRKASKAAKPDMAAFAARRLASLKAHYGNRVTPDSTPMLDELRAERC